MLISGLGLETRNGLSSGDAHLRREISEALPHFGTDSGKPLPGPLARIATDLATY
jgi:hypothetical protein